MNAANVARHTIFRGKPSLVDKNNGWKKQMRWAIHGPEEIQEIMDKVVPETTREATKLGMRLFNGAYPFKVSLKSWKNVCWDFTHSWRLRNNNNIYLNVTEWRASPGGTTFSKPIEEMSKEELNICLKCFYTSARKKDGTYNKSSSTKSIRAAIDRFHRSPPQNKPFYYLWPGFYWSK